MDIITPQQWHANLSRERDERLVRYTLLCKTNPEEAERMRTHFARLGVGLRELNRNEMIRLIDEACYIHQRDDHAGESVDQGQDVEVERDNEDRLRAFYAEMFPMTFGSCSPISTVSAPAAVPYHTSGEEAAAMPGCDDYAMHEFDTRTTQSEPDMQDANYHAGYLMQLMQRIASRWSTGAGPQHLTETPYTQAAVSQDADKAEERFQAAKARALAYWASDEYKRACAGLDGWDVPAPAGAHPPSASLAEFQAHAGESSILREGTEKMVEQLRGLMASGEVPYPWEVDPEEFGPNGELFSPQPTPSSLGYHPEILDQKTEKPKNGS